MEDLKRDPKGDEPVVVPVVAEELRAGVRRVATGGVRIRKEVGESEEIIDQPLRNERVEVRRVVRNEVVSGPLPVRQEGATMIVPVVKEVLKVEKQFILTEELHVTKHVTEERHVEKVMLQHEQAEVDRIDAAGNYAGPSPLASVSSDEPSPRNRPIGTPALAVEPQVSVRKRESILEGTRKAPARKKSFLADD